MQREIKFRGKRIYNGEWVYGEYMGGRIHVQSSCIDEWWGYSIIPETVGQYTGFFDGNREDLYEDDFIENDGIVCHITFIDGCWECIDPDGDNMQLCELGNLTTTFLVGNAHDNPELLKTKE